MLNLYPPGMLKRYVIEKIGIDANTWHNHSDRFPRPLNLGPGNQFYYDGEAVEQVLQYWRHWWSHGHNYKSRAGKPSPI